MKLKFDIGADALILILESVIIEKSCSDWLSITARDVKLPTGFRRDDDGEPLGKHLIVDAIMKGGKATVKDANTGLVIGMLTTSKIRAAMNRMMNTDSGFAAVAMLREGNFTNSDIEWLMRESIR